MKRLTKLSLRLRVFLFFCLVGFGSLLIASGALAFGWSRMVQGGDTTPFVIAIVVFGFANTGFALGIWLLFDENIAKPITKLAADLRLRAHSGIQTSLDEENARYLGDLAPAARALSDAAKLNFDEHAQGASHETVRLLEERERLTALLSEIPIATILVNPAGEIVLYDAQAAAILERIAAPRLRAPLSDYFDMAALNLGEATLRRNGSLSLPDVHHRESFSARVKPLGKEGEMIFLDLNSDQYDPEAAGALVFDFALLESAFARDTYDSKLSELCFVALDTETTGLSVKNDEIVQIAGVRILNGRIINGEVYDSLVNPGRSIPASATKIHRVTDADVADAPDIATASRAFHGFASDAVLVAHNAPFDIGLLRNAEASSGVTWDHPVLDTVLLSAVVFGQTEDHSLDALCARLEIEIPPAVRHTALGDAQATAEAVVRLLPLLQGRGIETFGDLVREMKKQSRLLVDLNPDVRSSA